jgi:hypothetical protein
LAEFLIGHLAGGGDYGVTSRGMISGEGSVAGKMHAIIDGGFHVLDGLSGDVAAVVPALAMPAPGGNGGDQNGHADASNGQSDSHLGAMSTGVGVTTGPESEVIAYHRASDRAT